MKPITGAVYRWRYLFFAAWAAGWAWYPFNRGHSGQHGLTDWDLLRFGGRAVVDAEPFLHAPVLHLYAEQPEIQVGPPALAVNGVLQRVFSPSGHGYAGDVAVLIVMIGLGLLCVLALERLAAPASRLTALVVAATLMAFWSWGLARYGHIEDAIAIACIMWASVVVSRRGPFWQAGLLLGLAIGCKPWAVIAVPILLALPARDAVRAAGVSFVVAVAPWLPFLAATPHTLDVFRGQWTVDNGSALHALGVPLGQSTSSGFRIMQFAVAITVGLLVSRRSWPSALLAAFAVRVLLDPSVYGYYGLGPLVAAGLLDLRDGRRVPWWSISTVGALFVALTFPAPVSGVVRAVWAVAVMAVLLLTARRPAPVAGPERVLQPA